MRLLTFFANGEYKLDQTSRATRPCVHKPPLERLAGDVLPSSSPRSTSLATKAAGTPAARFLPLPYRKGRDDEGACLLRKVALAFLAILKPEWHGWAVLGNSNY